MKLLSLILALLLASCVADPSDPLIDNSDPISTTGVIVVNEGVWFQDNASLTHCNPRNGRVLQDYFSVINPTLRLGDLGNDITIRNNRAFITVTTSQAIEVIEVPSGIWKGRLRLPAGTDPRSTVIVNDTTGYVTGLKDDAVTEFDPSTLTIRRRIPVGPAPEGLAAVDSLLFVTNSGFGILRQEEPGAGTLSVIRIGEAIVRDTIAIGPNPQGVRYLPATGKLYVLYGLPESPGGIAEVDPFTREISRRWPVDGTRDNIALDTAAGIVYAIGTQGLWKVDPRAAGAAPELVLASSGYTSIGFYSVGVGPDGRVYIGFTRGFTIPGSVLILERSGEEVSGFECGLNPGAFGFY